MSSRHRNFAFTAFCIDRPELLNGFRYIGGVQEKCPTTGKIHWQCHVVLNNNKSLSAFIKSLPDLWGKPHVEVCKGSFEQNRAYCSLGKGLTPPDTTGIPGTDYQLGDPPAPGTRSDLSLAVAQTLAGGPSSVEDLTVLVKYHRGLDYVRRLMKKPRVEEKKVIWLHGPTKTGKTQYAYDNYPLDSIYRMSSDHGWFDGYHNQPVILLDEYETGVLSVREFFGLVDKYPFQVKVKGGMEYMLASTIIITSHYQPAYYFPPDRHDELHRRLTQIIETKSLT